MSASTVISSRDMDEAAAYLGRLTGAAWDVPWSHIVDNASHEVWGTSLPHDRLWQALHGSDAVRVTATPTGEVAFRLNVGA